MSYERWLVLVAIAVLGFSGWWFLEHAETFEPAMPRQATPMPAPALFSPLEVDGFLAAAMKSEAIADPMQRCLAYPDPPESHWSHAAVQAYCRYRTQPFLHLADAQDLIGKGQAAELDRRLAEAQLKQRSEPDSRGLLDHIYVNDFDNGSPELRASLDAWKRQSPKSAFAYAASGWAYLAAAGDARGSDWAANTSSSQFAAMSRLLSLAKADLVAATRLDPKLTPTYTAMVMAARLQDDDQGDFANSAIKAGLDVDPSSYALYAQLMVSAQPKWGGSMRAMEEVAAHAQAQSSRNPLLELLLPEPDAYASGICGCGGENPQTRVAYRNVLDRIAATATLSAAGNNAMTNGQREFALVYLSEALRFDPSQIDNRMARISTIGALGARPNLSYTANLATLAEADRTLAMTPSDSWTLAQLGQIYVGSNQWNKAWSIADQLTKEHPNELNGWVLRAMIQKSEPRPGLHDTAIYIVKRYGNDPSAQAEAAVAQARQDLANERSSH